MNAELVTRIRHRSSFVFRLVLLVPLFAGLVVAGAAHWPSSGTLAEFREAVAAGEVDRVNYRAANGELMSLTWSESPLVWHEVEGEFADQGKPYTTQRLMDDVHRPAVQPSVTQESNSGSNSFPDWPFETTAGWWIIGLWWLAFLAMFFSTPRLANRWAWFWLFTVGQIGVFFYLLLEPRPLWRGLGEGVPRAKRMDGPPAAGSRSCWRSPGRSCRSGSGGSSSWFWAEPCCDDRSGGRLRLLRDRHRPGRVPLPHARHPAPAK